MTAAEASLLALSLTQELCLVRGERDAFRAVASAAINHAHSLQIELERLRTRYREVLNERRRPISTGRQEAA